MAAQAVFAAIFEEFMPANHASSNQPPQRTRGQVGVGLLVGGVTLAAVVTTMHGMALAPRALAQNPSATFEAANVKPVIQALQHYASTSTDGRNFPASEEWLEQLSSHGLLPGNVLPPSPWTEASSWFGPTAALHRQANELEWPKALVGAKQLARGARASAIGTVLGDGHAPTRNTFDVTTYGAMLYDADPTGQVAVLYSIGQRDGKAVIASVRPLGQASSSASQILRQPLKLLRQSFEVTHRAPNHDTIAWHVTMQNRATYDVPAYVTLFFQGGALDDNLKTSGAHFDLPAGKTVSFDGHETLAPGEGGRLKHIRVELDGHNL
jgi:hypothetical protein